MTSLVHHSLYALVKSGAILDKEDPVIRDALFSVHKHMTSCKKKIYILRNKIQKNKELATKYVNFKSIPVVDYVELDKIIGELSTELFDNFTWVKVKTTSQAAWKQYFHSVYDLLVPESSDHIGNNIISNEILNYHDVIPKPVKPIAPHDTNLHVINRLMNQLKQEQINIARLIGDLHFHIISCHNNISNIQMDIVNQYSEIHALQQKVDMFQVCLK